MRIGPRNKMFLDLFFLLSVCLSVYWFTLCKKYHICKNEKVILIVRGHWNINYKIMLEKSEI